MLNKVNNLIMGEEGQGMTEYGLVVGIIAIGAIVALIGLRDQISALIDGVKAKMLANTPV